MAHLIRSVVPMALMALTLPVSAAVLIDQTQVVTHPGAGAGGADESRLQSSSLGMSTIGFGAQTSANNSVADDFTLTTAADIDTLTVLSYQTGSTTTSTFNSLHVRIWNGAPNGGGTVVCGDLTTERYATSVFSNIYRVTETTAGNTQRPIMWVTSTDLNCQLQAGTFWVEFQLGGTLASGPWLVPTTILGVTGPVGANGLQNVAGTWNNLVDGGTGTPPQAAAFRLDGTLQAADLQVAVDNAVGIQAPGGGSTYQVVVSNAGPLDVTGATLATQSTLLSAGPWTCTAAGGASCPAASGTGELNTPVTLNSGQSLSFSMQATNTGVSGDTASKSVTVTAPASPGDPNTANNTATDSDLVLGDGVFLNGFEDPSLNLSLQSARDLMEDAGH